MIFCPNCGTRNEDDARFCQVCGSSLTGYVNVGMRESKTRSKEPSKMLFIVIVEAIILIMTLVTAGIMIRNRCSAESVAEKYIKAYVSGDWEKVYDLTDFPSGRFLQKEQFVEAMSEIEHPLAVAYKISSNSETGHSGNQKTFYVQYANSDYDAGPKDVCLVKQKEKFLLFFNIWKVESDADIAENYRIYALPGAALTVDGTEVEESDRIESDDDSMECYQIRTFAGNHTIQMAAPWYELYKTEVTAVTGGSFMPTDMRLSSEGEIAVQAKMQEVLEQFYQNALEGKDYSTVAGLFLEENNEYGKNFYNHLVSGFFEYSDYVVEQIEFSNFDYEITYPEYYTGDFYVTLTCDYEMDRVPLYESASLSKSDTKSGDTYISAYLGYDGETYKLTWVDAGDIL